MTEQINQDEINSILWRACDTFRGTIDPAYYKDYILVMLFLKYISDTWQDKYEEYSALFDGDDNRIQRRLSREKSILPKGSDYYTLYEKRNADNIGEEINKALAAIEDANREKLENVFRNIDFNSEVNLGKTKQRNERLKNLLQDFNTPKLNLRPSRVGNLDVIGNAYEYLIGRFASDASKKAGEFYTPPEVSTLLAKIVDPQPNDRIADPTCGSGSLLIKCAKEVGSNDYALYGQEMNGSTWALCMMNMFLHNIPVTQNNIKSGDTIRNPNLIENRELMKFDIIVANPPIGVRNMNYGEFVHDSWGRFNHGVPSNNSADFLFLQHILATLNEEGRAVVLVPNSILFRGGTEGKIRQSIVEDNLVEAVIALPSNMLYGTSTSTSIIVFNKGKEDKTILFIDATQEFEKVFGKNVLRQQDIERVISAYNGRDNIQDFAYLANIGEIAQNDFYLEVHRYIISVNPESVTTIRTGCSKTYDIFVSYSRKDTSDMKTVSNYLRNEGFIIWTDETLEVGTTSWQDEIAKAIENTCALVVLLSPDSKQSAWVLKELNYADNHGVKIFPVITRGSLRDSVPLMLSDYQYHDFQSGNLEELRDLLFALKKHMPVEVTPFFIHNFDKLIQENGWGLQPLRNLVDSSKKIKGESDEDQQYPVYSPSGEIIDVGSTYNYDGEYLLVARTTSNLLTRTNPIVFVVDGQFSTTGNVTVLKAKNFMVTEYLKLAISVIDFHQYVSRGIIPSLNKRDLLKTPIPVPSYDEQLEIVSYISEKINHINSLQEQYHKQIDTLEENALSIVRRIFTAK